MFGISLDLIEWLLVGIILVAALAVIILDCGRGAKLIARS
jgi:hypothetical protein